MGRVFRPVVAWMASPAGPSDDRSGTIAGMFDSGEPAARPLFLDHATGELTS